MHSKYTPLICLLLLSACNSQDDQQPWPHPPGPSPTPSILPSPTHSPLPSISPSVTPSPEQTWQFSNFNQDLSQHAQLSPLQEQDFISIVIGNNGHCIGAANYPPRVGDNVIHSSCTGQPAQQIRWQGQQLTIGELCLTSTVYQNLRLQTCSNAQNQQWEVKNSNNIGIHGNNHVMMLNGNSVQTWASTGWTTQNFHLLHQHLQQSYNNLAKDAQGRPLDVSFPIRDGTEAERRDRVNLSRQLDQLAMLQPPYQQLIDRSAHLASFHGQLAHDADRVSVRFPVNRRFNNGWVRGWDPRLRNWTFARVYAPPGELVRVHVESDRPIEDLFAIINVRTDTLNYGSGNSRNQLLRPSTISTRVPLQPGDNYVRNPYGGSVVIESMRNQSETIWIRVDGAVRQPFFRLNEHSNLDWQEAKEFAAPFAILEGPQLAIGLYDRERWQSITDPVQMLTNYEQLATWSREITGFSHEDQGPHAWPDGFQFLVQDVEISAGFAHAGFPIMAQPGFRIDRMQDSFFSWGIAHEIGHNYQHQCLSSHRYGVEATVNIWSSYVQERRGLAIDNNLALAMASANQKISRQQAQQFSDFTVWEQLAFQMQMIYGLPGGWNNYRLALRALRELPLSERERICASEQAQWDIWYLVMSQVSGVDLRQHFSDYRVPLSPEVLNQVQALQLPSQEQPLRDILQRPW